MAFLRAVVAVVGAVVGVALLMPVVLVGVVFWLVSFGTRRLQLWTVLEPRSEALRQLVQYEPVIGWKNRPNLDTHGQADDVFHLRTDDEGWRGRQSLDDSKIVVFGDSFAFGQGVDECDHFTELDPSLAVKTVGVNAYNLVQELLWMQRLAPRLRGKLVVWMVYLGNDVYENLNPHTLSYRIPFVGQRSSGEWEIVSDHVVPEPWSYYGELRDFGCEVVSSIAALSCPGRFSDRAFSACQYLVRQGYEVTARAGADLVVISVPHLTQVSEVEELRQLAPDPSSFDVRLPDDRLREICRSMGVEFVALLDRLGPHHYLPVDRHWNAAGHQLFAEVLSLLAESQRRRTLRTQWTQPGRQG
jgi:hypothetical protein